MQVVITGGTGFVGSHVARFMLAQGHSVRLLVRDVERARTLYERFGGLMPDFVLGDVTSPGAIAEAVAGCDSLVHAAAATPMQIESVDQLFEVNVRGVENVVSAAMQASVANIVCLSSITAIFDPDGSNVTAHAPPARSNMPYGKSKMQAEQFLRTQQASGAPIAIVYPGGVIGPNDPGFSDSCKAVKHRVEQGFRIFGDGGMQYVDVRDLAAFITSLATNVIGGDPDEAQRYLVPGVYSDWNEQADLIEQVSGASLNRIPAQGWKLRFIGRLMDVVRKFKPLDSPISAETMRYATLWPNIDNSAELERRGIALRPLSQTFDDTLRWMVEAGHLDVASCPAYADQS